MSNWVNVVPLNEFTGQTHIFVHNNHRIALFKLSDQEVYAIDDECSHAVASLADGELEGYEVACPDHGARFDIRTGEHKCFPAITGVKSYPIKIENGEVIMDIEALTGA